MDLLACLNLLADGGVDSKLEDLIYAMHLFAAAFDVHGVHAHCDRLALLWCHGSQTLGFEKIDAGTFGAKVGFEADEDEGCCRAEVEDFRVPLFVSIRKKTLAAGVVLCLPCPSRSRGNLGNQWRSRRREGRFQDMRVVEAYRTLLVLQYPKEPAQQFCL